MRWGPITPPLTVLLADGYKSRPDAMLDGMARAGHSGPVVGAASSENGSHGKTYQFYEDRVTSNSVVGFSLSGAFETVIDITQGCQPVGEPMAVTKAHENLIFEIDHRPAFEVSPTSSGNRSSRTCAGRWRSFSWGCRRTRGKRRSSPGSISSATSSAWTPKGASLPWPSRWKKGSR